MKNVRCTAYALSALLLSAQVLPCPAAALAGTDEPQNTVHIQQSQWNGKKVAFLGDSITDKKHVGTTKNYWQYLAEMLHIEPLVYGINGNQWNGILKQAQKLKAEAGDDTDAILIFCGTNDYNAGIPLGEWYTYTYEETTIRGGGKEVRKKRETDLNPHTFRGRINEALTYLKHNFPDKQIILLTPIHRAYAQFGDKLRQPSEAYSNGCGLFIEDYVQAVREAGQIWSVPVIDLFSLSGLSPMVEEQGGYFRNPRTDRLHPGTRGHMRLAYTLAYQLLALPSHFPKYVALSFAPIR